MKKAQYEKIIKKKTSYLLDEVIYVVKKNTVEKKTLLEMTGRSYSSLISVDQNMSCIGVRKTIV